MPHAKSLSGGRRRKTPEEEPKKRNLGGEERGKRGSIETRGVL